MKRFIVGVLIRQKVSFIKKGCEIMHNKITLSFPINLTCIAGRDYAIKICEEQVFPMLAQNQCNDVYFPDQVENITTSFLEEFMHHIKKHNKINQYTINVLANSKRLNNKINTLKQLEG